MLFMGLLDKLIEQAGNIVNGEVSGGQPYQGGQPVPPPVPLSSPAPQYAPVPSQPPAMPMPANVPQESTTQVYDEHLENLIEMALTDGVLTEKEKQVLFKRAEAQGIDRDEFEMVLEAKLYEKKQSQQRQAAPPPPAPVAAMAPPPAAVPPTSSKYGDLRKCPSCGALVDPFSTTCSDCGYSFTNVRAVSSFEALSRRLDEIDRIYQNKEYHDGGIFGMAFGGGLARAFDEEKVLTMKKQAISTFPIPTTKEDLLEFLAMGIPLAKKKGFFSEDINHKKLAGAWASKLSQIVIKARLAMKDDPETLNQIEQYAKELEI